MTRAARFSFRREFDVPAPVERVQEVLVDLEWYAAWWPEIVAVGKLSDDDALVICKSALPYELELHLTAVHREPERLEVALDGDLEGFARFELSETATGTHLVFTEQVEAVGRVLRTASYVARPLLVWNHDRMLESCLRGLRRRVQESMWDMSP